MFTIQINRFGKLKNIMKSKQLWGEDIIDYEFSTISSTEKILFQTFRWIYIFIHKKSIESCEPYMSDAWIEGRNELNVEKKNCLHERQLKWLYGSFHRFSFMIRKFVPFILYSNAEHWTFSVAIFLILFGRCSSSWNFLRLLFDDCVPSVAVLRKKNSLSFWAA